MVTTVYSITFYLNFRSVSTMILFKNNFAINRDMSDVFKRFEVGRNYFGDKDEENKIFKVVYFFAIVERVNKTLVLKEYYIYRHYFV